MSRRYRHCRCRRNVSPLADTLHAPLTRWGFTLIALVALAGNLTTPFLITAATAAFAWKHR